MQSQLRTTLARSESRNNIESGMSLHECAVGTESRKADGFGWSRLLSSRTPFESLSNVKAMANANPNVTPEKLAFGVVQAYSRLEKAKKELVRAELAAQTASSVLLNLMAAPDGHAKFGSTDDHVSIVAGDHVVTVDQDYFGDWEGRTTAYVEVSKIPPRNFYHTSFDS